MVAVNARYALGKLHNPEHDTTSSSARELTDDGPTVFERSKRVDSPYRSGPSKEWLKSKNPASEAVRRKREEEWR